MWLDEEIRGGSEIDRGGGLDTGYRKWFEVKGYS